MSREWDGAAYQQVARPHAGWAATVLDRLELAGDEVVLDAGCGSGKVTEQLLARLPQGRVIGVDGSALMLEEARRRLHAHLDRVSFVHADLAQPLPVGPVDAVASSATFHWIADHGALFANLAAVLHPGGHLSAQCGGVGNVSEVQRALDSLGIEVPNPWHFATPEEAEADLVGAGFVDIEAWLTRDVVTIPPRELETYLATVMLGAHLERLPESDRPELIRSVAERVPGGHIDYVRLNLVARRP